MKNNCILKLATMDHSFIKVMRIKESKVVVKNIIKHKKLINSVKAQKTKI